ncbi:CoA-binding protein [Dactylosporangium sp. NBC_01737]|uniref:CoA-binding protein n=1 Tax=Dactylosporangium sp. NBC_01737 TaxID=2975959 RepID=UPI002E15113A|nr:CoA-binding protein [Dactylosporangium sp. NBC_01737]
MLVTGPKPSARRFAAGIARPLAEDGAAVVVVSSAAGAAVPDVHAVASLAETAEVPSATEPIVVVCDTAEPEHTARVRELTVREAPRTVVVLVGAEHRSHWSIHVQPSPVDVR